MTVEERLTKLERTNRKLLWLLVLLISACGLLVVTGASRDKRAVEETVMAKQVLVTENRESGIVITPDEIRILDENNKPRFRLGKDGFVLDGKDGETKAALVTNEKDIFLRLTEDGKSDSVISQDKITIVENNKPRFILEKRGFVLKGKDEETKASLLNIEKIVGLRLNHTPTKEGVFIFASGDHCGFDVHEDGRTAACLTNQDYRLPK